MNIPKLTFLCLFSSAGVLSAATVIDTTPGNSGIAPFGVPNTATYGQTITAPADNVLDGFSFEMAVPSTLQFKGYVFAWDNANNRATGSPLFSSPVTQTLNSSAQMVGWTIAGGLPLITGQSYVLFASISEIDGQSSATGSWSFRSANVYTGGGFTWINNGSDESLWTSSSWAHNAASSSYDMSFTARFSAPTPTPDAGSSLSLFGLGLGLLGVVRRFRA